MNSNLDPTSKLRLHAEKWLHFWRLHLWHLNQLWPRWISPSCWSNNHTWRQQQQQQIISGHQPRHKLHYAEAISTIEQPKKLLTLYNFRLDKAIQEMSHSMSAQISLDYSLHKFSHNQIPNKPKSILKCIWELWTLKLKSPNLLTTYNNAVNQLEKIWTQKLKSWKKSQTSQTQFTETINLNKFFFN